jgi:hypothetical protein
MLRKLLSIFKSAPDTPTQPDSVPHIRDLYPPSPYEIEHLVQVVKNNPNLTDSGVAIVEGYAFELDGCMDWSSVRIKKVGPDGDPDWTQTLYRAYRGVNSKGLWDINWMTDRVHQREEILDILRRYNLREVK